jgi:urease accessory protein
MKRFIQIMTTLSLAICLMPVYAHSGINNHHSFISGLVHPWSGLDHLLVLFGVGLYAATYKSRFSILLPIGFLIAMICGVGLAYFGFIIPALEQSIIASLFIVGALLIVKTPISFTVIFAVVAYFALCHGYVHALEMRSGESEIHYLAGLILSSALIAISRRLAGLSSRKVNHLQLSTGLISILIATFALAY